MTQVTRHWIWVVSRCLLAIIFIWAAIPKMLDPFGFVVGIKHYEILPIWSLHAVALTLPWIELVCGVALILGRWTDEAASILIGMLVVYIVAIASTFLRGIELTDCGCFGKFDDATPTTALIRDVVFVLIGTVTLWANPARLPGVQKTANPTPK